MDEQSKPTEGAFSTVKRCQITVRVDQNALSQKYEPRIQLHLQRHLRVALLEDEPL